MYRDGEVSFTTDMTIRFVKVTDDYSQAILGTWEGRSTGEEGSEFDDGKNHRWEYKADGTYIYYRKIDGQWQEIGDITSLTDPSSAPAGKTMSMAQRRTANGGKSPTSRMA
jgi:hypothetical protein